MQMQQPHAPKGHGGPPHVGRKQGAPDKRMKQKTKPLNKRERGQPTKIPEDFYKAMPAPKGAKSFPVRPTQDDERAKRAQAAAMAVHDGLDASMPMDQRKVLYGNAKPTAPVGQLYNKYNIDEEPVNSDLLFLQKHHHKKHHKPHHKKAKK